MELTQEPLVSLNRLAERHKVGVHIVTRVMRSLELQGDIRPHRTPTKRCLLSFADAQRLDAELRR